MFLISYYCYWRPLNTLSCFRELNYKVIWDKKWSAWNPLIQENRHVVWSKKKWWNCSLSSDNYEINILQSCRSQPINKSCLRFDHKFIRQQLEHLENVQGLIEAWTPKQVQRPADTFSNLLCSRDSAMRVDLIMWHVSMWVLLQLIMT